MTDAGSERETEGDAHAIPRDPVAAAEGRSGRLRLAFEFAAIYVAAPVAMAALTREGSVSRWDLPAYFAGLTAIAVVLLVLTRGFSWRRLVNSPLVADWRALLAYTALAVGGLVLLKLWLAPEGLFAMPRYSPDLWQRIILLYPILSVLPQALIYRALFFGRYRALFPGLWPAILANAAVFGLAHLFYMNPYAVGLSVLGGLAFAWAHAAKESFWFANLLHAISGWTLFTVGLGRYFYHGAI